MSTRGLWGFVIKGEVKVTYNHSDSYPSGLGDDVLRFAREMTPGERTRAADLRVVDHDWVPTAEEIERLKPYADLGVGTKKLDDPYVLLRRTLGAPDLTLEAGVMVDGRGFAANSLFCEWGYVIDLDEGRFEVYRGFQHGQHTAGRFAADQPHERNGYWPIRLVASWPLSELPTELDEEALAGDES